MPPCVKVIVVDGTGATLLLSILFSRANNSKINMHFQKKNIWGRQIPFFCRFWFGLVLVELPAAKFENTRHKKSTSSLQCLSQEVPELRMLMYSQFVGQIWNSKETYLTPTLAEECTGAIAK